MSASHDCGVEVEEEGSSQLLVKVQLGCSLFYFSFSAGDSKHIRPTEYEYGMSELESDSDHDEIERQYCLHVVV